MQAIAEPPPVVTEQQDASDVAPDLPTEQRPDGALVIDLIPLAPPPTECAVEREPDPFNPEIVVCGETMLSPPISPDYGPSADQVVEGSAIPRARVQITDNAAAEANATAPAVGGFHANGGEVRAKINFCPPCVLTLVQLQLGPNHAVDAPDQH